MPTLPDDLPEIDPDAPPGPANTIGLSGPDPDETDSEVTARLEAARAKPPTGRRCKRCDLPLPEGAPASQRYCDEHRPGATHSGMTGPNEPVNQTTINVGSTRASSKTTKAAQKAEQLDAVERNTRALFEHFVAPMLNMAADARQNPLLKDDAADFHNGAPAIAKATRNLAEHEDWLRKMLAGGEASARAVAWMGFLFTVGPVVVPVLVRHKVLPAELTAAAGVAQPVPA